MNSKPHCLRRRRTHATLASLSHDLRGALNGIETWTCVLERHLRDAPAPVQRAIAGIRAGIRDQVRAIESLAEPALSGSPSLPGQTGKEGGSGP